MRRWHPSQDPSFPRSDSEELWHLRSGHLGKEALSKLVLNARGVKIRGTARKECESCALTHAKQIISRRPPESQSPRPFWRVHWDLQDYSESYNGMRWMLVCKDEYSKMIIVHALPNKTHATVFNVLVYVERWVARQFGLSIARLKQDNERAVISDKRDTQFQTWAHTQGIVLECSPPYTHEPNGNAERANQTITTKSIAMLKGANLPSELWPESAQAATYLYNISPSQRLAWQTPILNDSGP